MRRAMLALLIVLAPTAASAQSTLTRVGHDWRDAGHDLLRVWASPVHIRSSDWPTIGLAAGTMVAAGFLDPHVQRLLENHGDRVPILAPFRNHSPLVHMGELSKLAALSGGFYLAGVASGSQKLRDAGTGCLVSGFSNSIVRHGIYLTLARGRPAATNDPYDINVPGGDWNQHSFFGGHAANAFGCSTFWAKRFDLGYGEVPLYVLGGGIALGRTADGFHWFSDTVAGVIFGYAIGNFLAERQLQRASAR